MLQPDLVVEALDGTMTPDDPPAWVEVYADETPMALVRHDDLAQLFGWVSPPDCRAVGVVAGGWGRPEDGDLVGPASPSDAGADAQRVRVIVVVNRDAAVGSRTTLGDGSVVNGGCRGGRLFDALHRCLGLATDGPPASSAPLLGGLWLAAVVAEGHRQDRPLAWSEIIALHPATRVLADQGHDLSYLEMEAVGRVAPRAWTWERRRADTVEGAGLRELVAPEVAAWMDPGMFARWTLDVGADAGVLWGRAVSILDSDAVLRLADALAAAELGASGSAAPAVTRP